jgi:hypothetical protein
MTFTERMQQEDKAQHIICAFLVVVLLLPMMPLAWAAALVFGAGLVKEGWDGWVGTGFCWYDIAANAIGIVLAGGLMVYI